MALLASDLNLRFDKLFKKFGKGKEVPVKFYNGQDIINGLLTNIDHLLEEDEIKGLTQEGVETEIILAIQNSRTKDLPGARDEFSTIGRSGVKIIAKAILDLINKSKE